MAGEINLEVVADIAKAKAGLAELTASIKAVEKATGQTAEKSSQLAGQFEKAGKRFARIGEGGAILAAVAAIKQAIQLSKEWDASLADLGKKTSASQFGALSLAQAMPKKLTPVQAAELTAGMTQKGARLGLSQDQTSKELGGLYGKMKGADFGKAYDVGDAYLKLRAAGVSPEEAAKQARKESRDYAVAAAGARKGAMIGVDPGLARSETVRRAQEMANYERTHPTTDAARRAASDAYEESLDRPVEEIAALRAGFLPKEGEGFNLYQHGKQTFGRGMGRSFQADSDSPGYYTGGKDEARETVMAARELGEASRNVRALFDEGTR